MTRRYCSLGDVTVSKKFALPLFSLMPSHVSEKVIERLDAIDGRSGAAEKALIDIPRRLLFTLDG